MKATALFSLLAGTSADVYLQYPPGSNNRLDEGGGNRNNNNRLMDTQNNAKGGYGYGGSADNPAENLKYFAGSIVRVEWTSQHSCGSGNNQCDVVLQYMCNPDAATAEGLPNQDTGAGEGPLRDGTDNTTPDPNAPDPNTGLHESASFYNDCAARERNKGLYTADQNLNNNQGAVATRQNPNGARSGQECSEERDYYPYWHPTPWKDIAILTNNLASCDDTVAESQNVKGKNYCSDPAHNNEQDCKTANADWLEQPPFGLAAPECICAPEQRDNHLGNVKTGDTPTYDWKVPFGQGANGVDDVTNCVLRIRYNITTADTQTCSINTMITKDSCEGAGGIWSNAYTDESYNDNVDGNGDLDSNGQQSPPLLRQNPDTDLGGFLLDTGGTNSYLSLAVNTNQYGRTFEDRSHEFSIQERPAAIGDATVIYNLNVRGKRGNIVQTYPACEYDFVPQNLKVGENDMVHIHWTGNDNTNNNGNNNGEGTNNEDRHNIVQQMTSGSNAGMAYDQADMFDVAYEWNSDVSAQFGGARDKEELKKQAALVKQTDCLTEDQINNDQDAQNCQKLNAASATCDLGLVKFKPGHYKYFSSRNNNFSNRAQKATIEVVETVSVVPAKPENVVVEAVDSGSGSEVGALKIAWSAPGSGDAGIGFDGKEYWGCAQSNVPVVDYKVSYSLDGGETWVDAGSQCSGNQGQDPDTKRYECVISGLPAGTTIGVAVQAGGTAGYGEYSNFAFGETKESRTSEECSSTLLAQAEGTYVSPGTIVAIVFGVVAGCLLIGGIVFVLKRRQPPPPPAGMGFGK